MEWTKTSRLTLQGETDQEIWMRYDAGVTKEFPMDIYLGKKTDLLNLKKDIVKDLQKKLNYYAETRKRLFQVAESEKEYVDKCPVTGISTSQCQPVATIYGAEYVQSPDTGHVFLKYRPSKKSIHDFYLNDVVYAATYTDKASAEGRLNAIAVPWIEWTLQVYKKTYGHNPTKILDVGSGAGHFVEACRRKGIHAEGIELSKSSREFAKEIWGFEMYGADFNEIYEQFAGYDIVTFWGLLEHTPNPAAILQSAYKIVSKSSQGGMVISKLPRWNSLSSASQRLNPETIIRHIDPMGHIMLFSDASAAELYYRNNFKPCAAWYYGMDVYETFMQQGNNTGEYAAFLASGRFQVELQQYVDENRFSDGLTIVGIPIGT